MSYDNTFEYFQYLQHFINAQLDLETRIITCNSPKLIINCNTKTINEYIHNNYIDFNKTLYQFVPNSKNIAPPHTYCEHLFENIEWDDYYTLEETRNYFTNLATHNKKIIDEENELLIELL